MCHVCADKVTSGEGGHEGEFTGHDGGGDNTSELLSVRAWGGRVCAFDAEHFEDSLLGCENGTTADSSNLDGRHGDSHEKILAVVVSGYPKTESEDTTCERTSEDEVYSRLHESHTVRRLDVLRRVLTSSQENRRQDIRRMRIEPSD